MLLAGFALTIPVAAQENPVQDTSVERRDVRAVVESIDGLDIVHNGPGAAGDPGAPDLLERTIEARTQRFGRFHGQVSGRRIDGTMTTTYERRTPRQVQDVIDAAVAAWDDSLTLSPAAPLEISVLWTDLGPRLLGQAGTEGEYRDPAQFPTDRWYPAALANQLANLDVNGASTPEIMIELNSGLGDDWYIGTEGNPAFGQIDLYSVVLHEIAHGLGFLGSAVSNRTDGVTIDHDPPSIYDDLVVDADGVPLVELDADRAIANLTSEALFIDIGGGRLMPLSAPTRFVNGSSYSHFDESIAETDAGAMMTPALKNGEVQRELDAAVLGVLNGIGWGLDTPLLRPTISDVEVRSGGLTAQWVEDWSQRATLPANYEVTAVPLTASGDLPDPVVRSVRAISSPSLTLQGLQNGTSYQLSVAGTKLDHADGPTTGTTVLLPPNPNVVRELSVSKRADDVALRWNAPVSSGEPIHTYEVQYRAATDRRWQTGSTSGTAWTFPLEDGRYWFRVRALNDVGDGLWFHTPITGVSEGVVRPMPLDGQLARLYRAYFDRNADAEGLRYWREVRSNGVPLAQVSSLFERSAEFDLTYGSLTDDRFVTQMYLNVLGRSPDPAGFDYWMGLLAEDVSRGEVVLGFSESAEFIRITETVAPQSARAGALERIHMATLRRAPTSQELNALSAAGSLRQAADSLVNSAESRAEWDVDEPSELLEAIARNVGAEPGVVQTYLERLEQGSSVAELVVELVQRPEYIAVTGTGV